MFDRLTLLAVLATVVAACTSSPVYFARPDYQCADGWGRCSLIDNRKLK